MEEMNWLLCDYAADPKRQGLNALNLLMGLSGVMVEACYLFEQPDDALDGMVATLAKRLHTGPSHDELPEEFMPTPYVIDAQSEQGRDVARHILNRTFDEPHAFASMVTTLVQHHIQLIETIDVPREESFRMLIEFAQRGMVMEIAAQELCDVLIEHKVGRDGWSLGDCIAALSGLSGYKVAVWYQNLPGFPRQKARAQAAMFDQIVDVMTREAVRYGIAGGTDWTFGLPANDVAANPPSTLVSGVLPFAETFFKAVRAFDPVFQATCLAKAAGRMVAVASGGEMPDISPAISKPLAMAAMTESYRSLI